MHWLPAVGTLEGSRFSLFKCLEKNILMYMTALIKNSKLETIII